MFRALWRGWLVVAKKIGYVQSYIVLVLAYFIFVAPFALAVKRFLDPLGIRVACSWQQLPRGAASIASLTGMRQQSWGT